jgi:hypothetical protein
MGAQVQRSACEEQLAAFLCSFGTGINSRLVLSAEQTHALWRISPFLFSFCTLSHFVIHFDSRSAFLKICFKLNVFTLHLHDFSVLINKHLFQ